MNRLASFMLNRLCVALGLALLILFAGISTANAIDRIQHGSGSAAKHVHSPISLATMTIEQDQHDLSDGGNHNSADRDDDRDGKGPQPQPGHHHHADGGSGLPAFAASDTGAMPVGDNALSALPDRLLHGLTSHGPERPPKA